MNLVQNQCFFAQRKTLIILAQRRIVSVNKTVFILDFQLIQKVENWLIITDKKHEALTLSALK